MLAQDRGLVLRSLPLRETSKIVTLLSRRHGKLRLVARGVRGPRSRAGASLESGNEVEFVFSLKPGRDLGHFREVALRRSWLAGSADLTTLGVGWAGLELLDRVVPDGAPEEGLLDVAWGYLEALHTRPGRAAAVVLFYAFELQLLERLGLRPELDACRLCGRDAGRWVHLDLGSASWTCDACRAAGAAPWRVAGSAIAALQVLQHQPWEEIMVDARTRRAVGLVLHRLLAAHVERYRYPRSLRLLKRRDSPASTGPSPEAPETT